jgi:hypothetical protein
MSDEVRLSMSLPLDGEGFLRRECPTCEREFKWLPSPDPEDDVEVAATTEGAEAPESYYCPYCAVSAPPDTWMTKAQVAAAARHVLIRGFGTAEALVCCGAAWLAQGVAAQVWCRRGDLNPHPPEGTRPSIHGGPSQPIPPDPRSSL